MTQSLGALPFSVGDVQPDFAVAAGYKWLLGPYSTGVLYVAPKWQGGMPLEENWIQRENARDFSSLTLYSEEYDQGARRFDMGERSNFALLPAAVRAMKQAAGMESGADLGDGGRAQSSAGGGSGGVRILFAGGASARASLSGVAEEAGDPSGTAGNAGARKGIRQRAWEFGSRYSTCV